MALVRSDLMRFIGIYIILKNLREEFKSGYQRRGLCIADCGSRLCEVDLALFFSLASSMIVDSLASARECNCSHSSC